LVAGLRLRGLTAAKTFDGPINAALFEDWVETCLVPTLSPGEIVVMDNLPAHKGPRVEQLIKAAGAELRYLPAYSPDMNPIEKVNWTPFVGPRGVEFKVSWENYSATHSSDC